MQDKYGSMYDGMRTESPTSSLYTSVFCIRRLLIVIVLLYVRGNEFLLIYMYLLIFSVNFFFLAEAQAHTEGFLNKLELLNELGLIGVLYNSLFFIKTNRLDAQVVW